MSMKVFITAKPLLENGLKGFTKSHIHSLFLWDLFLNISLTLFIPMRCHTGKANCSDSNNPSKKQFDEAIQNCLKKAVMKTTRKQKNFRNPEKRDIIFATRSQMLIFIRRAINVVKTLHASL